MKRIKVFEGATVVYDDEVSQEGVGITTNTEFITDVPATEKNKKKYLKKDAIIKPKEE
jgi:hypothetical protein